MRSNSFDQFGVELGKEIVKTQQEYYRELILDLIPMDDDLEANGASKEAIDAFREMVCALQEDYKSQYGEIAWWS